MREDLQKNCSNTISLSQFFRRLDLQRYSLEVYHKYIKRVLYVFGTAEIKHSVAGSNRATLHRPADDVSKCPDIWPIRKLQTSITAHPENTAMAGSAYIALEPDRRKPTHMQKWIGIEKSYLQELFCTAQSNILRRITDYNPYFSQLFSSANKILSAIQITVISAYTTNYTQ